MKTSYKIIRNGNVAGQLKFQRVVKDDFVFLKTESEAKAIFLITINTYAKEEAIYKNDILLYSSIYRKRNGSEKTNMQTRLRGNEYVITTGDRTDVLKNYPIRFNLLSMYSYEPRLINRVYSDYFKTYVPVEKIVEGNYKVIFPDGNYSYYHYKNGVCSLVEVHSSLYSASLVLNN